MVGNIHFSMYLPKIGLTYADAHSLVSEHKQGLYILLMQKESINVITWNHFRNSECFHYF